jgi:hypothetical protein
LAHVHAFIVAISHRPHRANAGELAAKLANTFSLPIQTTPSACLAGSLRVLTARSSNDPQPRTCC